MCLFFLFSIKLYYKGKMAKKKGEREEIKRVKETGSKKSVSSQFSQYETLLAAGEPIHTQTSVRVW